MRRTTLPGRLSNGTDLRAVWRVTFSGLLGLEFESQVRRQVVIHVDLGVQFVTLRVGANPERRCEEQDRQQTLPTASEYAEHTTRHCRQPLAMKPRCQTLTGHTFSAVESFAPDSLVLGAGYALVLQHPHNDAPVFSLSLRCCVRSYLPAGAHRPRCQDVRQRNVATLLQEVSDVGRPLLAQLLVQGCGAHRRCVALYLNHIASDGRGLLAQ